MRIKYQNPKFRGLTAKFPTITEVNSMTGYVVNDMFAMRFVVYNNKEFVIEFRCTINNDEAESYEKAVHTFESVQASLALDGYANLMIGEKTSLLNDKWWLEESEE